MNKIKDNIKKMIPDKLYLKYLYKKKFNESLNLKNPKSFNECLQWIKLYDRKKIYTTMVDKYEVKKYISDLIGEEYVIPTIGVYDTFEEINFEKLPNQFVIKCTHDSGSIVICKDKKSFDIDKAKIIIDKALRNNYYYNFREWPYKNVKPRIIIEPYLSDNSGELKDYKFYCFNGKCDYVMLCVDRFKNATKYIYFDKNWNIIKDFSYDGLKYGDSICVERPLNLDKMFDIAKKLSKNIYFVRVDFYENEGKLFFGEFTFFPSGGFDDTRTSKCKEYLDKSLVLGDRK